LQFGNVTDTFNLHTSTGETMVVYTGVFSKRKFRQADGNENSGSFSLTKFIEEIEDMPIDRQSIPQENLDLANKFRTSIFPWRGQFSPELVELLLRKYAKDTSVVLDPFVGSGTTLFEASARKLACYGVEINPSAIEMAKTAHFTNVPLIERKKAIRFAEELAQEYTRPFIWDLFSSLIQEPRPREEFDQTLEPIFKAMLREADGEPFIQHILVNALIRYMSLKPPHTATDFLLSLREHGKIIENIPFHCKECRVLHADARSIPLSDHSIDLIITSPPYINVFNYHQNNRPAMELLGWDVLDIAKSEIGANRKHRQNRFLTVIQYSLDILDVLHEMKRLLRPDGRAIIVIGKESNVRGLSFKNGMLVAAIAIGGVGFQLETRQERTFKNKFGETIREDILHLVPGATNVDDNDNFARLVASWYLVTASQNGDEEVRREALEAKERAGTVQKSPLLKPMTVHM
jgi:DNA modification methylase